MRYLIPSRYLISTNFAAILVLGLAKNICLFEKGYIALARYINIQNLARQQIGYKLAQYIRAGLKILKPGYKQNKRIRV